jgi:hypothetical protein
VAALWRPGAGGPSGLWFWVGLFGWVWAGLAAALGPLIWEAAHLPAAAPEQARAHWVSGNVTMVEVTDFDCPHCQRADPIVREWLGRHPGVRFVRLVCPIPAHENAWPAALAYVAAARQGKGEEMATALYTGARDPVGCRRTAERLGHHLAAYDKVVKDPATESEIRATMKWVEESRLGLPFFWIQDELVVGTPAPERLDAALARAKPAP